MKVESGASGWFWEYALKYRREFGGAWRGLEIHN